MRGKQDSPPQDKAMHMVNQLGGEVSARREAMKFRKAAHTPASRRYWSTVLQWINSPDGHFEESELEDESP